MALTTEQIVDLMNEAKVNVGFPADQLISKENYEQAIENISQMSVDQINALVNQMYLVAEQRGYQNIWTPDKNPYRRFLRELRDTGGWTIMDYMFEILEGITPYWNEQYTNEEVLEGLVKDYEQKIRVKYHYTPFEKQFPTTINEKDYGKYFLSAYTMNSFVNGKIANLSNSAEVWLEKSILIDELKQMIADRDVVFKKGYEPNSSVGIKHMIEDIQTVHTAFSQPTSLYNKDGVISITPSDEFKFLFVKSSLLNRLKVYIESGAYNLDKVLLPQDIIEVPEDMDLGVDDQGKPVLALLVDRRAIVMGIRTWRITNFFVANKLRRNYFLSVEGLRGHNTFINAVAFSGEPLGVFTK